MSSTTKLFTELLELVDSQVEVISRQKTVIARLVNENMEKENIINVLCQEQEGMY